MKPRNRFTWLAVLILALPTPAAAQAALRGQFTRAAEGTPIEGAAVVLLTDAGRQRAVRFTDAAGRFSFEGIAPGRYRIRAERVGFQSTLSPVLELGPGAMRNVALVSTEQTVQLQGLQVRGRRRCTPRPGQGPQTAAVWDEARKALTATAATPGEGIYRFHAVVTVRERDPSDLSIRRERAVQHTARGGNPFPSLPAEQLAMHGYVQPKGDEAYYYAPDAQVLLSDLFLEQHCFALRRGTGDEQGLLGLAFRPAQNSSRPDVEGVLWLDPATSELRHLEYSYTGLTLPVRTMKPSGRLEFRRLPSGGWIVERWWIRMPVVELQEDAGDRAESFAQLGSGRTSLGPRSGSGAVLHSIREQGGEITQVLRTNGTPVYTARLARVHGTVLDSITLAPLAAATVTLLGTNVRATTDSAGHFRLDGVRQGVYALGFVHPRLDSLGLRAAPREVHVTGDSVLRVDLAGPSLATGLAAWCPGETPHNRAGVLIGSVGGREGVAGPVRIVADWSRFAGDLSRGVGRTQDLRAVAAADSVGRFHLCALPADRPLEVRAFAEGRASAPREIRLDDWRPLRVQLILEPVAPSPAAERAATAGFFGLVLDEATGKPLRNVDVVFPLHGIRATTADDGRFALPTVPAGLQFAELRLPGYPVQRLRLDLPAGRALTETLRMSASTMMLEEISVRGRRSTAVTPQLAGFYERAAKGRGQFVTREQIEAQAPHRVTDVLRQVPGLYLYQNLGGEWEVRSSRAQGSPAMPECPMRIFLDGLPHPMTESVDRLVQPHHVEGVEIYPGTQMPAQYAGSKSACGVLAIWTRAVAGERH